jgi:predicted  nucleic acid-binding Zn-ribbon protein
MTDTNEDEPCSWPIGNCSLSEKITQLQADNNELWREVRVLQDSNNKAMDTITQLNVELYEMREALRLADAALKGANMNMNVVEKKICSALKGTSHD